MLEDFKGLSYLNLIPSSDERVICDAQVSTYLGAFLFMKTIFYFAYLMDREDILVSTVLSNKVKVEVV